MGLSLNSRWDNVAEKCSNLKVKRLIRAIGSRGLIVNNLMVFKYVYDLSVKKKKH